jgi:hypothetical protein
VTDTLLRAQIAGLGTAGEPQCDQDQAQWL